MSRQGIIFIPLRFVLSGLIGLRGICLTQYVSDAITFILAVPFGVTALHEMKENEENRL